MLSVLSNVKFRLIGDPCNESERVLFLFLAPTWDAITSEAPCVVKFLPVHGVITCVDVFTAKVPMGRLRSRTKKTGTLTLSVRIINFIAKKIIIIPNLPPSTIFPNLSLITDDGIVITEEFLLLVKFTKSEAVGN